MTIGPLAGLRVLEIGSWLAAPLAGRLFATLGAEVTKVEAPAGGDQARRYGPFLPNNLDGPSGVFAYLNVNKRSVTIDLSKTTGQDLVKRLAEKTDLLLVDLPPEEQDAYGLTYEALRQWNEQLVVCSITAFGRTGPRRDYAATDITVSAAGGMSVGSGDRDEEPLPLPLFQTDMQAGLGAAAASMVAILARSRAGGQEVDISAVELMASQHAGTAIARFVYDGISGVRQGRRGGHTPFPEAVYPCKDRHVVLVTPQAAQWIRFVEALGTPAWSTERRYRDRRAMAGQYPDEADALITPWLKERTKAELLKIFVEYHLPYAPLLTAKDILENEHLRDRQFFVQLPLERDSSESVSAPGAHARFSRSASHVITQGAPALGQDTFEVLTNELGVSTDEYEELRRAAVI